MEIVERHGIASVAFPVIGAGSGGFKEPQAVDHMLEAFQGCRSSGQVVLVRYRPCPVT
jgi:O-acetyl-ADP-ribose deacetylase (regulator of RNase III)